MTPVSRRTALLRGLRCLCPACGRGPVFAQRFVTAKSCVACGFSFERGDGHWIGGNEINVIVTYPTACLALAIPAYVWGANWGTAAIGGLFAAVLGVALHRPSRGLFFAIDYLVEPQWDAGGGDRRDGHEALAPSGPRGPGVRRVAPVVELPVPVPSPRTDAEPDRTTEPAVLPPRSR